MLDEDTPELVTPVEKRLSWYKWRDFDIWSGSFISQLQGRRLIDPTKKIPDHKLHPQSRNCNPFRLFKMHDEAKGAKPAACPVWSQGQTHSIEAIWVDSTAGVHTKALGLNKKRQSCPCNVRLIRHLAGCFADAFLAEKGTLEMGALHCDTICCCYPLVTYNGTQTTREMATTHS